ATSVWPSRPAHRSAAELELAFRNAASAGDAAERPAVPVVRGRLSSYDFSAGRPAASARLQSGGLPTFGQPTIAGVGGFGFEADLRLDPGDPTRIYESVPGTGGADTSWIWRSLDGGKTFKWVPSAAPLNGKATPCVGG